MKILLLNLFFKNYTGSELYAYELGRELVDLGHDVYITGLSSFDYPMVGVAENAGIIPLHLDYCKAEEFDIVQTSEYQPTVEAVNIWDCPIIQTVHSEVDLLWNVEKPYIHEQVKHYIAIRPAILDRVVQEGVPADKVSLVYNPIDFQRFYPRPAETRDILLFAGSITVLREKAAEMAIQYAKEHDLGVRLVGLNSVREWRYEGVEALEPTWNIEDYVAQSVVTAGILLGRTTLEGFAMGKPALIYDIDGLGNVLSVEYMEPPEDKSYFDSKHVALQIEGLYNKVIQLST